MHVWKSRLIQRRETGARVGWNLLDQALVSLTNAGLSLLVANAVDARGFGTFALAFIVYQFFIGGSRALISDPLVVNYGAESNEVFRATRRAATGSAALLGVGAGLVVIAAAALLPSLRPVLLALAVTLPGLAVQDAFRLSFIGEGRPRAAAINDLTWAALQFSAAALLLSTSNNDAAVYVLVWGATAGVCAVLAVLQAGAWPALRNSLSWLYAQRHLSGYYFGQYVAVLGAFQVALILVAAIGGVEGIGSIRAAQVLLGPLNIVFFGIGSFALPEIVRRRSRPAAVHVRMAVAISGGLTLVCLLWGAMLLLLPDSVGQALLGDAWTGGREVIPAMLLVQLAVAATAGAAIVIRAFAAARIAFALHLMMAPLIFIGGVVGVIVGGARGAAIGFAIAQSILVPLWWIALPRVLANPLVVSAPTSSSRSRS